MKPRKFVNDALMMVKTRYPELYRKHIKGRRIQFTSENALSTKGVEEIEKSGIDNRRLGYVNKDLRLLLALSTFFYESVGEQLSEGDPTDALKACTMADAAARISLSYLFASAFWEFAKQLRFVKKDGRPGYLLFINHDCSIWSIAEDSVAADKDKCGPFERFLTAIEGQCIVGNLMAVAISHIEKQ